MKIRWRYIFVGIASITAMLIGLAIALAYSMARPNVTQSAGFDGVTADAIESTLSGRFPAATTNVRYSRGSAGLGGRFVIYRFSAPLPNLHAHAKSEFAAHWDKPQVSITPLSPSPFTEQDILHMSSGFAIAAGWMRPSTDALGTVYASADGQSAHRPTIFVDDTNSILYFWMTD